MMSTWSWSFSLVFLRAGGRSTDEHLESRCSAPSRFTVCTQTTMSSTYAHYQGSSSIPSDLSHLPEHTSVPESQPENTPWAPRQRESSPTGHFYRPHNPTTGSYPYVDPHSEASRHLTHPPTEATPLLSNPPVPRIEENIDTNTSTNASSNITMFWEELTILTKYVLPVFGYAHSIILHESWPMFKKS